MLASELPEQVRPLATAYVDQALEAFDQQPADVSARMLPDTDTGRLASTYLLALLEGDRRRASRMILNAVEQGHDVRELYLQVLLAAQAELGGLWMANEINVAEEHFASQTTRMVMAQLLPHASFRPPNGKTMLAAAVAGNQHEIGLQAVADFFESSGPTYRPVTWSKQSIVSPPTCSVCPCHKRPNSRPSRRPFRPSGKASTAWPSRSFWGEAL